MNIFVGPSGELEVKDADTQRSVNLMPTHVESGMGKAQMFLKPVPGLTPFSLVPAPNTFIVASYLYPIMNIDFVDVTHALTDALMFTWLPGQVDVTHSLTGGVLLQPLKRYDLWPVETVDVTHSLTSGVLLQVLKTYSIPVETIDVNHVFVSGELVTVLKTYINWPAEKVDVTHAMTGGTLT